MRTRRVIATAFFTIVTVGFLLAKEKWDDVPFQQWNRNLTVKLFNDSPWAQSLTYSSELGTGAQGLNEAHYNFVVRVFSSLPMREAYVRMLQLMNNYDGLPAERQKDFDARVTSPMLNLNVSDEVVIAVSFQTNDPNADRELKRFFSTASTETLSQQAYIYSPQAGRVDLKKYVPPGSEGIGARFIYSRVVNGKPMLNPGDREMRFELWINPINQQLRAGFDSRKMVYKGELSY
jgi:hypothetical protein